ncbi:Regulatory protein alcR [Exophiala dermatitidis]|uniref:Zn(2)-C6 fungal-type domain-containing protein n=1 Tax=Exophiala dermatitidis (strain ATCC 34100 / CBS 525.76 / NIH/UT8656) TaxID=858893 RepID=H6C8X9_EXODN|nr:uncharacterized protein HMPREF1120_08511 [Exophiala dermatitidis NIH/UT8656]EHY60556.1 hypothetical protein HMPREF1120_08511 [Exophiala dermatitidis NIH/UT8656]
MSMLVMAPAAATTQAPQPDSMAAGYSKTTRRQYQSCDQCRRSRRACDAGTLMVVNFPFAEEEAASWPTSTCQACSNCAKSGKKCTFDWLRSLPLNGLPKGIKRKLELTGFQEPIDAQRKRSPRTKSPPLEAGGDSLRSDSSSSSIEHKMVPAVCPRVRLIHEPPAHVNSGSSAYREPHTETKHDSCCLDPHHSYHVSSGTATGPSVVPTRTTTAPALSRTSAAKPSVQWDIYTFARYNSSCSSSGSTSLDSRLSMSRSPGLQRDSSTSSEEQYSAKAHSPKETDYTSQTGGRVDSSSTGVLRSSSASAGSCKSASTSTPTQAASRRPSNSSLLQSIGRTSSSTPLSPRQIRFADGALKAMIATGFLRIYHDSFENSLSCWVTERNCPYDAELGHLFVMSKAASAAEEPELRLGDNRIFSRVSRLDSAFSPLRGRRLTTAESRTASKALNAAIMAFASQWSHRSHNSFWKGKGGLSSMKAGSNQSTKEPPSSCRANGGLVLSSECERVIRKTLWHEAWTAIQASAGIDSFRVILAYLLFALTQRPMDKTRSPAGPVQSALSDGCSHNDDKGRQNGPSPQPIELATDAAYLRCIHPATAGFDATSSPPIYLETAVRNLFAWRRIVERYRRSRSYMMASGHRQDLSSNLDLKDQQTFNMLFWLGVMCDTTSSAITKRPLIIPDDDCAMVREQLDTVVLGRKMPNSDTHPDQVPDMGIKVQVSPGKAQDARNNAEQLWGHYLLTFQGAEHRKKPPRWPCSFDEAAVALQAAIPVKVLMFRKIAQLQTLADRQSAPAQLEQCIQEAIEVCQHWNTTYGPFMHDCVSAHDSLLARVQSWYVILDGHWHYGCLLLADAIAQLDREERTMAAQRGLRARCGLITEIRKENAYAISAIAGASLAEHAPSFPDNPDFSFACNGSAILTEPWTDVLVRAMGSACNLLIEWLAIWQTPADELYGWVMSNTEYDDLYVRAENCIQGMALLGRKSDSAQQTAEFFWARLNHVSACQHHHNNQQSAHGRMQSAEVVGDCSSGISEPSYLPSPTSVLTAV